jgi:hypothetical protein
MNKRFGVTVVIMFCVIFVTIPVLLYADDWYWDNKTVQQWWKSEIMVRGTIHLAKGTILGDLEYSKDVDEDFVGVKNMDYEDLWTAGWLAWNSGADESYFLKVIYNPDPNVNPSIIRWMKQNKVLLASTDVGFDKRFNRNVHIVIRYDAWSDSYSTAYYEATK